MEQAKRLKELEKENGERVRDHVETIKPWYRNNWIAPDDKLRSY